MLELMFMLRVESNVRVQRDHVRNYELILARRGSAPV